MPAHPAPYGGEQHVSVAPDLLGTGPSGGLALRDMVVIGRLGVALGPYRIGVPAQPLRGCNRQGIQRRPQRRDGASQTVEGADGPPPRLKGHLNSPTDPPRARRAPSWGGNATAVFVAGE
jgi:hypothetical protein